MSRIGGWPKNRLYSRLNWLGLSYPTSKAALAASSSSVSIFCRMEPKLFLKLKRAHRCETTEVMIQSRSTHACHRCEFVHIQHPFEIVAQPIDGLRSPIALVS